MIVEIFFFIIITISYALTSSFPTTTPLTLPWGIDPIILSGVEGYRTLAQSFPPFTLVLNAFLIYIGFRLGLQFLKGVPILGRMIR